ncbi:MAG: beta strand repeat-containing protein [Bacteroidota bacterium]
MWYDVGTISVTNGSTTVTGSGTDFISGVQVGEGLYIGGDLYEIGAIVSGTQLTLADAYLGSTATGQTYKIIPTQSLVADLSSGVADLISDFADVRDYAGSGKFNDGTASSPAITFTQDQNNGLYRIGSDNWGLVAGGEKIVDVSTNGIKLDDNNKATFGTGNDLQIYHDGSNSYINNVGSGSLIIQDTDGNGDIYLRPKTGQTAIGIYNDNTVEIAHAGTVKLATTSTGVDVTGTVTADSVSAQSGNGVTASSGTGTARMIGASAGAYFGSATDTPVVFQVNQSERMRIDSAGRVGVGTSSPSAKLDVNGDISVGSGSTVSWGGSYGAGIPSITGLLGGLRFYPNGSTSGETMRIDSTGNVGIGTASPNSALSVATNGGAWTTSSSDGVGINYNSGNANISTYLDNSTMKIGAGVTQKNGLTIYGQTGGNRIQFDVAGSERARIDSSGNLLVGKTSSTFDNTAGIGQFPSGRIYVTRNGGNCLYLNRVTSDGDIAAFYKDGSVVGSIGTTGGALDIKNAVAGGVAVSYENSTNGLLAPIDTTGAFADGLHNLGRSNARFKDLYLSGGVYLGGTGAANKLDDYETGVWTPTVGVNGFSASPTTLTGSYTKVGRVVTARLTLQFPSTISMSSYSTVNGLPFSTVGQAGTIASTNTVSSHARVAVSGTTLFFAYLEGTPSVLELVITYETNA